MTWAAIQGNSHAGASAVSTSVAFAGSVAVGNLVVVNISWFSSTGNNLTSVSDNAATPNTYTLAKAQNSGNLWAATYYAVATTGGAFTVKAQFGANAFAAVSIEEYSFAPGTISISSNNGAGATSLTAASGNVTFTAPKALIIGTINNSGANGTVTPNTGFTKRASVTYSSGATEGLVALDFLNATSSPQNPGYTGTGTTFQWVAAGVAFQSSGDILGKFNALLLAGD